MSNPTNSLDSTVRGRWQVVHQCETVTTLGDRSVVHVAVSPCQPCATPLSDLRDSGVEVVSYWVLPSEIPDCTVSDGYPGCEHLLLRPSPEAEAIEPGVNRR